MARNGTFCIIRRPEDGAVLVCHRRDLDIWDFPGGGFSPEESPWEAAIREAYEEVKVRVRLVQLACVLHRPEQSELAFGFFAEIEDGVPTISDEVRDIKFVQMDDLPKNFNNEQRSVIEKILAHKGSSMSLVGVQFGPCPRDLYNKLGKDAYADCHTPTTLFPLVRLS